MLHLDQGNNQSKRHYNPKHMLKSGPPNFIDGTIWEGFGDVALLKKASKAHAFHN